MYLTCILNSCCLVILPGGKRRPSVRFSPQGVCLAWPRAAGGHPHATAPLPLGAGQRRRLPAAPVLRRQPGEGGGEVTGTRCAAVCWVQIEKQTSDRDSVLRRRKELLSVFTPFKNRFKMHADKTHVFLKELFDEAHLKHFPECTDKDLFHTCRWR